MVKINPTITLKTHHCKEIKLFNNQLYVLNGLHQLKIYNGIECIKEFQFLEYEMNLIDFNEYYCIYIYKSILYVYDLIKGEFFKKFKIHISQNSHITALNIIDNDIYIGEETGKCFVYDLHLEKIKHRFRNIADSVYSINFDNTNVYISYYNGVFVIIDKITYEQKLMKKINEKINKIIELDSHHYLFSMKNSLYKAEKSFPSIKCVFKTSDSENTIDDFLIINNTIIINTKYNAKFILHNKEFTQSLDDNIFEFKYPFILLNEDKGLYLGGKNNVINYYDYNAIYENFQEKFNGEITTKDINGIYELNNHTIILNMDILKSIVEKRFKKDILTSIKLVSKENKFVEAIEILEKWATIKDKEKYVASFKQNIAIYPKIKQLYKEKKYTIIYNLTNTYDFIKYLPEYLLLEMNFNTIIQKITDDEKLQNESKIREMLSDYHGVIEKQRIILNILKYKEQVFGFFKHIQQKNYKMVYAYIKKIPKLEEFEQFKNIDNEVDEYYKQVHFENSPEVIEEYLNIIIHKEEYHGYVTQLKGALQEYKNFKHYIGKDKNSVLMILDTCYNNPFIKKSEEFKTFIKEFKEQVLDFKKYGDKTNKEILKAFKQYLNTPFEKYILAIIKKKYIMELENYKNNAPQDATFLLNMKKYIINYVYYCGVDTSIETLREELKILLPEKINTLTLSIEEMPETLLK